MAAVFKVIGVIAVIVIVIVAVLVAVAVDKCCRKLDDPIGGIDDESESDPEKGATR